MMTHFLSSLSSSELRRSWFLSEFKSNEKKSRLHSHEQLQCLFFLSVKESEPPGESFSSSSVKHEERRNEEAKEKKQSQFGKKIKEEGRID